MIPLLAWLGVFGLIIGSFLNVCIGRLPRGESVVSPPSRCPNCHSGIRWYDNIPVLSYLMLRGRCRSCGVSISVRYPITEGLTAVAFVLQGVWFHDDPVLLTSRIVLTALLIVLFGTDLETQRLPNVITYPGIAIGLLFSVVTPPGLVPCAIGAAAGAGILWIIRWGWKRATGVDGMGLGDVKMLAMIGAFLGWKAVLVTLVLASFSGAIIGVLMMALQKGDMKFALPFGTFLAIGAVTAMLAGDPLIAWYAGFF